jgi:hypothetical protein
MIVLACVILVFFVGLLVWKPWRRQDDDDLELAYQRDKALKVMRNWTKK